MKVRGRNGYIFILSRKGKGKPFILLHGNGENGTYFNNQIEFFSDRYRMIAVDTRGHGKSTRGAAPFTIEQFAKDLNELMIELDIIQVPTLVIAGTKDMIKRAHTEEIARNIPNAKLSIIQGNHFIANKESNKFNKEVELFLQTVS